MRRIATGLILALVSRLFDAKESVAAALMVATYAEVPRLVQHVRREERGLVEVGQVIRGQRRAPEEPCRHRPHHAEREGERRPATGHSGAASSPSSGLACG